MESNDASAVSLHEEVAVTGFAVLECVGDEVLEIENFLETLATEVPDVENARMLLCAYAYGDVHAVANDTGALSYLLRDETAVDVLNAVVVEGIGGAKMYFNTLTKRGKREGHDAPTVAIGQILNRISIADEEAPTMVYDPLQGVSK